MASEHSHQVTVVNWFRDNYPDSIIAAVPNGGKRDKIEASKLKREGVLKGFPDLLIYHQGIHFMVEMKKPGGKLSADQKKMAKKMNENGFKVITAYSWEEAVGAITATLRFQESQT